MKQNFSHCRFLQTGSFLRLGLRLSEVARLRTVTGKRGPSEQDSAVILVWLTNGRSHLETDDLLRGAPAEKRPLSPNDMWATVYRYLGIDRERTFPDHIGRPIPILPDGEPIKELL